jgi:hypothetical protein
VGVAGHHAVHKAGSTPVLVQAQVLRHKLGCRQQGVKVSCSALSRQQMLRYITLRARVHKKCCDCDKP